MDIEIVPNEAFDKASDALEHFFENLDDDLTAVGQTAAEEVVRATLAGLGPGDVPFAQYSESYQKLLDSVGGKSRGCVDLRGVFLHDGQKNPRFRSNERRRLSGAGRQAYIEVNAGGKTFTARTKVTRPALGLTDPNSEMSLDLLSVTSDGQSFTISYNPRNADYMISHNDGSGRAPQREWFTLDRSNVITAAAEMLNKRFTIRVETFNG